MPMLRDGKLGLALLAGRGFMWLHARRGDPLAQVATLPAERDPYPFYERLRARGDLVRSRLGMHVTTSHRLCDALLRDQRFGVLPGSAHSLVDLGLSSTGPDTPVNPIDDSFLSLNPPEHTRLRRLVAPWFTPRALRERTPSINAVVKEFLDEVAERDGFDLVTDFAVRVPIRVIAELLGVPEREHARFARWGATLAGSLDGARDLAQLRETRRVLGELNAFFTDLVAHRRKHPGQDVVSELVNAHDGDVPLARKDLFATTQLLLVAGFETTVNLIGNGALALLADADARRRLVEDPSTAEDVVEEVLRYDTPVQYTARFALETVELDDVVLRKDDGVLLLLAAANHDPSVFAEPNRFDPTRANNREHLAFSAGIHYCLGAGLARIEAAAALGGLFRRFPGLSVAGPVRRRPSRVIRGAISLPVSTGVERGSLAAKAG
ncbi:cytochrome P450 [Solihabitans fulvus]|uniref:Cytochrome P450 n=1 Tax=Solihabitans fulvus TaxID=1892852 RepID=A0A5B2WTD5_9PSEU|nr:cytochrome P450 [Solihabitans fulvus]KAA2254090.1 cytochrome P450 [Solihabitans fulvus]